MASSFKSSLFVAGLMLPAAASFAADAADPSVAMKNTPSVGDQPAAVSPYAFRFALEGGDQAGGPVRYDTRFPTPGNDPNPTSYYHTQVFAGANFEIPFSKGAFTIGALTRRDFAHRAIEERSDFGPDGTIWTVKKMEFRSYALTTGWIFGRMYREAPWKVSLAGVFDVAKVSAQVEDQANPNRVYQSESNLAAMALRGRGLWRIAGTGSFDLHAGPELHIPIYSRKTTTSSPDDASWVGDIVDLKSSAAIGLAAEIGTRF